MDSRKRKSVIFLKILIGLFLLVCVLFFFLGVKSKKGTANGLIEGRLGDCPSSPNCASSETGTPEGKMVAPLSGTMAQAKAALTSLGGTITSESDDYISATFTSSLFKFVDDVELRPGDDGVVHIRSASRVGYSDRGANKKRIAAIRSKMKS